MAVSGNFGKKTFLVTKIVAVCPISLLLKPNDVKIAFPFILDYQNRVLTYFLGQNGQKKSSTKITKNGEQSQKTDPFVFA